MDALFPASRILILVFAALNFKSVSWRLVACSVVVVVLVADLPFARTGNRKLDYMLGAALGTTALETIRFLLLVRPLEEYRHEMDEVPAYQLPFIQRCFWLFHQGVSDGHSGLRRLSFLLPHAIEAARRS